jgi:hypothetical protein
MSCSSEIILKQWKLLSNISVAQRNECDEIETTRIPNFHVKMKIWYLKLNKLLFFLPVVVCQRMDVNVDMLS